MGKSVIVDIVAVIDRSGSMHPLVSETIGALNDFIDTQKKLPGKAKFTLVLFDNKVETPYDRVDIQDVETITKETYFTRGLTALYDAIGTAIKDVSKRNRSGKVIVLIQTDGAENASQEFTKDAIKTMVDEKTDKGWEFHFVGTGIEAMGETIGILNNSTVGKSAAGMRAMSNTYSASATSYRGNS